MADRHYEIERTMTNPSAGGTVTPTTTGESSWNNENIDNIENIENDVDGTHRSAATRSESKPVLRKRRRAEPSSSRTGIPRKTPRRAGEKELSPPPDEVEAEDGVPEKYPMNAQNETANLPNLVDSLRSEDSSNEYSREARKTSKSPPQIRDESDDADKNDSFKNPNENTEAKNNSVDEFDATTVAAKESDRLPVKSPRDTSNDRVAVTEEEAEQLSTKPPMHPDAPHRRSMGFGGINRRDDSARLRKTIQWLEEGARKLREDLADARAELYEERRATRLARREIEVAVREARAAEGAKHHRVIAELKIRLSQSPSRSTTEPNAAMTKAELLKDENHRREISAVKKRLAEADATIRKLRSNSLDPSLGSLNGKRRKVESPAASELRKLDNEVKALRAANKKLEEKLTTVCTEADKVRIMELRIQHENHEFEINALKKSLRGDAIRMMDEIRSKDREIERLGRLSRDNRKVSAKVDDAMRKLRENENGHQIRLTARIEDKIPQVDNVIDLCKGDCEAVAEVERLRELAIEQQEVIELLRRAVKEKERKLEQLSNKRKKEEFYKQWLELEPVAEVDDEEEHEEGDSALSSAPSSLSPQPGGYGQWQSNGVTREAYEAVLLEIDQLQSKFLEEQQELSHAKSQVRDLEKALLQETRGSQSSRRALSEKLRKLEEREANLLAEIAELGEQNELLEFRVLELEESPGLRETPDTADSGIVSPEPIHIFKEQNKQRDRAVATVLPFSSYTHPTSPIPVKKPSLSLQESGIFEGDDDDDDNGEETDDAEIVENDREIEFTSCGTQTEAPVGELLQEVQRLQELRERIQERAVKVPSSSALDAKTSNTLEFNETKIPEDKTSLYREKIRQLEERVSHFVAEQETKMKNDTLAKQREEDLLDENYRLTERVYWLENEMRNFVDAKKSFVDAETMTNTKNPLVNAETMTRQYFNDVETIPEASSFETMKETKEENSPVSKNVSLSSRCENIFRSAMREDTKEKATITKPSMMEVDGFRVEQKLQTSKIAGEVNIQCAECETLRSDYDEKIQQLAKAECRFRGRLIDFERKENAFAKTLKQVDVTWNQLEADHAKNLEEIGRRLEEKVECNRRIMRRLEELEMLASYEKKKESCSCNCYDASSTSIDVSSSISSPHSAAGREVNDANNNERMDIDLATESAGETARMTKSISRETQTNGEKALQSSNCSFQNQRVEKMETESLRRVSIGALPKNVLRVPAIDMPTEMAVEATEDIEGNTRDETDGVSRIHVTPEEESPAGDPTENLRVTIKETELDKKVRENWRNETVDWEGEGWVTKTWNTESYNLNGGSVGRTNGNDSRKYVFRYGGLRYVLYPEICV